MIWGLTFGLGMVRIVMNSSLKRVFKVGRKQNNKREGGESSPETIPIKGSDAQVWMIAPLKYQHWRAPARPQWGERRHRSFLVFFGLSFVFLF